MRTVARAALLAVVLAACAKGPGGRIAPAAEDVRPPSEAETADPGIVPSGPEPTGPGDPPDATEEPVDPGLPIPCDPATEAAVAAPVAAQLDALAAGDFVAAYAQASPFFRTVVPQGRFEALIRDGYPELLDVAAWRLEGCTVLNRRAVMVVGLTTRPGARRTLAYELSDTDEGWRIDGAQDAVALEPAPTAPEV
jgi:hypothetical protein